MKNYKPNKKEDIESVKKLHSEGKTDPEIAKILNCSKTYIRFIRIDSNLPTIRRIKQLEMSKKVKELRELNLNDREIGKILGKDLRTIGYHRKFENIPPKNKEITYKNNYDRIRGYMIRNSKCTAKRRNIEFSLSFTDFDLPETCPLLGIKLTYRHESNGNSPDHATLDRIDNSKGYIPGNVCVISRLANAMKNEASFEQLDNFAKNILILINYYKNEGALGNITDVFSNLNLRKA